MIGRREFITLLGGAAAARRRLMSAGADAPAGQARIAGFLDGL